MPAESLTPESCTGSSAEEKRLRLLIGIRPIKKHICAQRSLNILNIK